jgi:threonine dehydratase
LNSAGAPRFADIERAAARIAPYVHRTAVLTSASLDDACGARLFFKAELFQKVGAFKARGATNAVLQLSDEQLRRGVVTHSSGNHAAALARAAALKGAVATIVMPSNAPQAKEQSVRRYGGRIVHCEPTLAAREAACANIQAETGATLVHPYDDEAVIAGQGTAALELMQQAPELDMILAPIGGGGLVSGTAIAAHGLRRQVRVFGVEPEGADDAFRSLKAGRLVDPGPVNTIADGLRGALSERTFAVIQDQVAGIVTVSEAAIIEAMRRLWQVLKITVEPSSAVAYAAIMEGKLELGGRRVGVILTGGNLDLDQLPWNGA